MTKLNASQLGMLNEVKKRQSENFSFREFGYGLSTAGQYVKGWSDLSSVKSSSYLRGVNVAEAIKKAENTFTWCEGQKPQNPTKSGDNFFDGGASLAKFNLPDGVSVPKNALMVFRNVITTSAEDRDGDVLHTNGARIDEPMPLLWQHMPALPIGKMLAIDEHNEKMLRVYSVLLDMNELTEDTAKLIEAGVLRISHGFIPLKFKERDMDSKNVPFKGFDITEFEVMEESTVSVPSNRSAVIDMFSRDAFKSPIMRGIGKELFSNRVDKVYPGFTLQSTKSSKGGRELSKANIQLLRDVIGDLSELKETDGMSRSSIALINKNITALSTLVDKSTPADPSIEDSTAKHGDMDAFKSFLIKFITFDADDDQLEMVEELIATRNEIRDSIQVGSEYRELVS